MEKSFPDFVQAIKNGYDPYLAAASQMFQVCIKDVTKDQRLKAKTGLLVALYGGSPVEDEDSEESFEVELDELQRKILR